LASACSGNPDVDPGSTAEIGAGYQPLHAQHEALVAGHALAAVTVIPAPTATPFTPSAPVWPEPSSGDIALPDTALLQVSSIALRVGGLPVRIEAAIGASPPRQLTIESFGRAATVVAGVDGVLLRVSRSDGIAGTGAARIAIGYGAFRWAYGGDWASRLALWALPECALTSPGATGCRATRLVSSNDPVAGTVSAVVALGDGKAEAAGDGTASIGERSPGATQGEGSPGAISPSATPTGTLVMLAAGPSSAGGDYKATSLAPSATWSAGSNTGNFTWTYPLRLPPSLGGPAPKIDIAYTSSSVDGRMAATNNQPSMIGEGFDWQPGSVERRYASCADDMANGANNTEKTGDQCWGTDNASLTLAGHSGELLKDTSNPNLWHLRSDDGTRVERRTGGPNADNDGEYWVAITPDGTQYWFGGRAGSNAALTLPVFGNHASEPCHQTAFKDSACTQAYRWMLDYVVDPFGNTMTYSYLKETNKYAKNNKPEDDTVYDRDGYLSTIEYGTRTDSTGAAPMRVAFEVADRCLSDCGNHGPGWVDTPWDRECTADICSVTQTSPSFWTSKRLHSIKTQVWGGTTYRDVETWTLTHSFPNSDQPVLWLEKISHTGLVGGNQPTPDITFEGIAMPNRVDTNGDQYLPMRRYRMKTITSESGGKTNITYSPADCVSASRMPDPNTLYNNVLRCYPAKWTPDGLVTPISDFFHKYVVTDVVEADLSGSSTRVITHYDYVGDPAWHYTDDDGFIKADMKTWSQWRGYPTVTRLRPVPGP
jgi:hypothetical protein